jgi:hypothetical protein
VRLQRSERDPGGRCDHDRGGLESDPMITAEVTDHHRKREGEEDEQ